MNSLNPVLGYLGIAPERAKLTLEAFQYVLSARIQQANLNRLAVWLDKVKPQACTVAVAANNALQYSNNIAASPELARNDRQHQLLPVTGARHMAEAWQYALAHAEHNWIVLVHQDVYLPAGWLEQVQYAWHEAEEKLKQQVAVLGVAGVSNIKDADFCQLGSCVDRVMTFAPSAALPELCQSLDDMVLVFRKDRFLPELSADLGFQFYGADAVMRAQEAGLNAAVVDLPCFSNSSRVNHHMQDEDLKQKALAFHRLWQHRLPVFTLVAQFQPEQIVFNH